MKNVKSNIVKVAKTNEFILVMVAVCLMGAFWLTSSLRNSAVTLQPVSTVRTHTSGGTVKADSTTQSNTDQTTPDTDVATDTTSYNVNTTRTAANDQSTSTGNITTAASTTTPSAPATTTDPGTAPSTPSDPAPITDPTPQPSFHITMRPDLAHTQDVPFVPSIEQYVIPFDIVYDDGFVPTFTGADIPQCQFLVTPVADYHVLCNVSQKEAGTGFLVIQYDNSSVAGHYEVEADYSINGTVRTGAVAFDLQ